MGVGIDVPFWGICFTSPAISVGDDRNIPFLVSGDVNSTLGHRKSWKPSLLWNGDVVKYWLVIVDNG